MPVQDAQRGEHATGLADVIGETGLAMLVHHYGGMRLRIHTRPRPDSDLAVRLGAAVYGALQATYAGEEIDIPLLGSERTQSRKARVHAMRAHGMTGNQIARSEQISLRRVRAILSEEPCQSLQLDLFGDF